MYLVSSVTCLQTDKEIHLNKQETRERDQSIHLKERQAGRERKSERASKQRKQIELVFIIFVSRYFNSTTKFPCNRSEIWIFHSVVVVVRLSFLPAVVFIWLSWDWSQFLRRVHAFSVCFSVDFASCSRFSLLKYSDALFIACLRILELNSSIKRAWKGLLFLDKYRICIVSNCFSFYFYLLVFLRSPLATSQER